MYIHTHTHAGTQETADMTQETSEGRTILQLIGTKTSIKILWLILEAYSFLEKCCIVSIIATRMYVLTFKLYTTYTVHHNTIISTRSTRNWSIYRNSGDVYLVSIKARPLFQLISSVSTSNLSNKDHLHQFVPKINRMKCEHIYHIYIGNLE